eukprot:m.39036 g.39036  ORF g.39036 m.39036 type:complete len:426 (+) comp11229_c0_seq2:201-1478(+)
MNRLVEIAEQQAKVCKEFPLRRYLKAIPEMLRRADLDNDGGSDMLQLQKCYVLYMRIAMLVTENMPTHPEYRNPEHAADIAKAKRVARSALDRAAELKPRVKAHVEAEAARLEEERKQAAAEAARQEEAQRRQEEAQRQQAEALHREKLEAVRLHMERTSATAVAAVAAPAAITREQDAGGSIPAAPPPSYDTLMADGIRPHESGSSAVFTAAPPNSTTTGPSATGVATAPPPPSYGDAVLGCASPEELDQLRNVTLPRAIIAQFTSLARDNTRRNTETCAILCGTKTTDGFIVTHLVVPKQEGTSDSCQTLQEEELFDLQDRLHLLTLGWIHTHPTQTCFLSSVDLHTHSAYQMMLAEAIAVVVSPKYNDSQIFKLSTPHGMEVIMRCTQRGFHLHDGTDPPLFEQVGHVTLRTDVPYELIDLR